MIGDHRTPSNYAVARVYRARGAKLTSLYRVAAQFHRLRLPEARKRIIIIAKVSEFPSCARDYCNIQRDSRESPADMVNQ